jgi:hypothetical protein
MLFHCYYIRFFCRIPNVLRTSIHHATIDAETCSRDGVHQERDSGFKLEHEHVLHLRAEYDMSTLLVMKTVALLTRRNTRIDVV